MSDRSDLIEIRCRGCKQFLGVGPADFRIYCDSWCVADYPAAAYESRDALIETIFQTVDISKAALARQFDITRQRVEQIVRGRDITAARV